jgi:putative ABC transport system permease protein
VNEAMVRRMGWTNPLGKKFILGGGDPNQPPIEKKVVGVLKDFHQNSLYDAIEPLIIILDKNPGMVFIRTSGADVRKIMASVESGWKDVLTGYSFDYQFLDEDYNSQYKADEKRSQIFTAFSGLTVAIACLGLLGLSAFTTEQRTKEIGVRKIVGASINSLIVLVSREFFILVGIGMIIAFPAAWYFTQNWLQNFAYRIELKGEWATFLLSAFLSIAVTAITVGYYVIRAAAANPVKSLRDE